jgi:hypothetical protein
MHDVHIDAEIVAKLAPELEDGFREHLPGARVAVATKLAEALWREDIGDARQRFHGRPHAFDRVVLDPVEDDPLTLVDHPGLRAELASAVTGLALARSRRAIAVELASDADSACVRFERLATEGHNLHPCGRTRLGWDIADLLAHDLETTGTEVRLVRVPAETMIGDTGLFGPNVIPVHAWQLHHLLQAHPTWALEVLDETLPAHPTAALRTLLAAAAISSCRSTSR